MRCARCFLYTLQPLHSTSPVACEQPVQLVVVKSALPSFLFDSCVSYELPLTTDCCDCSALTKRRASLFSEKKNPHSAIVLYFILNSCAIICIHQSVSSDEKLKKKELHLKSWLFFFQFNSVRLLHTSHSVGYEAMHDKELHLHQQVLLVTKSAKQQQQQDDCVIIKNGEATSTSHTKTTIS